MIFKINWILLELIYHWTDDKLCVCLYRPMYTYFEFVLDDVQHICDLYPGFVTYIIHNEINSNVVYCMRKWEQISVPTVEREAMERMEIVFSLLSLSYLRRIGTHNCFVFLSSHFHCLWSLNYYCSYRLYSSVPIELLRRLHSRSR